MNQRRWAVAWVVVFTLGPCSLESTASPPRGLGFIQASVPVLAQATGKQDQSRGLSTHSKFRLVKFGLLAVAGVGLAGVWIYKKAMGDGSRSMGEQPLVK
jgi:hypothetical protein